MSNRFWFGCCGPASRQKITVICGNRKLHPSKSNISPYKLYILSNPVLGINKKRACTPKNHQLYILELISFDIFYQVFEEFYKLIIYVSKISYYIYNSNFFQSNYSKLWQKFYTITTSYWACKIPQTLGIIYQTKSALKCTIDDFLACMLFFLTL
jgi:hypothetical protein